MLFLVTCVAQLEARQRGDLTAALSRGVQADALKRSVIASHFGGWIWMEPTAQQNNLSVVDPSQDALGPQSQKRLTRRVAL